MEFVDSILIRLADPATRENLFDDDALEQVLQAAFDLSNQPVEGPFGSRFDELRLGYGLPTSVTVEGMWSPVGMPQQTRINLQVDGLAGGGLRAEAVWRGAIIARTVTDLASIDKVSTARVSGSIDDEIITALGGLPADPDALEAERRTRLKAKLQGLVGQSELVDDARFDAWLTRQGARSAGEMIRFLGGDRSVVGVTVAFTPLAQGVPPAPKILPLAAAILVRPMPVSIGELMVTTHQVRSRLETSGLDMPAVPGFTRRQPITVIWIVPAELFDDAAWPGAANNVPDDQARVARRKAAGRWLAAEGIGLVAV